MGSKEWPPCEVCGKPVKTAKGMLSNVWDEIVEYRKQVGDWEKTHSFKDSKDTFIVTGDYPAAAHWYWGHEECVPDGHYTIQASRIDTIKKALSWTIHLMEKRWLNDTDWRETVRRIYLGPSHPV